MGLFGTILGGLALAALDELTKPKYEEPSLQDKLGLFLGIVGDRKSGESVNREKEEAEKKQTDVLNALDNL